MISGLIMIMITRDNKRERMMTYGNRWQYMKTTTTKRIIMIIHGFTHTKKKSNEIALTSRHGREHHQRHELRVAQTVNQLVLQNVTMEAADGSTGKTSSSLSRSKCANETGWVRKLVGHWWTKGYEAWLRDRLIKFRTQCKSVDSLQRSQFRVFLFLQGRSNLLDEATNGPSKVHQGAK